MPPAFARLGQMGIPLYKFNIGRYAVKKTLPSMRSPCFCSTFSSLYVPSWTGNLNSKPAVEKTHTKTIAGMNELTLFSSFLYGLL